MMEYSADDVYMMFL